MKNFIKLFLILTFLFSISLFASEIIKIGTYENPPKIYTNKDGKISGFWADITNEIAAKENWEIQWIHGTWGQCMQRLEDNEIDVMIDVGFTEEREKRFAFSKETVLLSWTRLYTNGDLQINSILDLEGMKVAGLRESMNLNAPEGLKDIVNSFEIDCNIIEMDSYNDIFQALESKEIDAGITNKDFGQLIEGDFDVKRTPVIFQPIKAFYAINRNLTSSYKLIDRIDYQIKSMKANNKSLFYSSMEKHLGTKTEIKIIPTLLRWLIIIVIVLLIFSIILIRILRKLIVNKTLELKKDIERREKVEEKLRESSFLLETVLNTIPDVIGIQDTDHKIIKYNEAGYKLLGKKPEDIIGKECFKLLGKDAPNGICPTKEVIKTKQPAHVERYEEALNTWFDIRSYPVLDKNDNIILIIEHLRDITQQKKIERSLEESAQKLKLMIERSPIGVSTTNLKGEYLSVNPAYCEMVGYTEEELFNMKFSDITHPDDKEKNDKLYGDLINENLTSFDLEKRYIKKSGEIIHTLIRSNLVRDENGKPLFELAICEDITKQKKAINELMRSEMRMKAIFEDAIDVIAVVDLEEGKILNINDTVEKILSYKKEMLIGKSFSALFPPETKKTSKQILEELKINRAIFKSQNLKRKDGTICIMDLSIAQIPWAGSKAALINLRDASERIHAEKIIQKDLKEKEVMLMEIHHRVKNNLQIISSMLKMQSVYIKDPKALEYFKDSQNRVKSMSLIHESLYQSEDLSKIDLGRYIKKLTNQLIRSFKDLHKDINMNLDIDDISFNINKTIPLGLLINEIVSNSFKYAFVHKDKGNINISLKKKDELYSLIISDDGSSIPEDFDLENSESFGLHLVNALTSQLHGQLVLERSHGTNFKIEFRLESP